MTYTTETPSLARPVNATKYALALRIGGSLPMAYHVLYLMESGAWGLTLRQDA
jgi:hypothetical protein